MLAQNISTFDIITNNIEVAGKGILHSSHSTDTEPEIDGDNSPNIFRSYNFKSSVQVQKKPKKNEGIISKKKLQSTFDEFYNGIPTFEYDQQKIRRNQMKKKKKINKTFYKIEMKNNRFLNYLDAFLNIAQHCHQNNQKFSQENCKEYLKDCYIIDFSHDHYIPITSQLMPKQFIKYFRLAQREQKYL